MLKHVKEFIEAYDMHASGGKDMQPSAWWHNSTVSKYAILLVARPDNTRIIDPYIKRARERFNAGARRLYVFGANKERKFANAVVAGIEGTIDGVRLIEQFETPYDYRGELGGMGAVFEFEQPTGK